MRITSRDGNVIAADFKPKQELKLEFRTQILYADAAVCLIRITYSMNGAIIGYQHVMADHTNNTDVAT